MTHPYAAQRSLFRAYDIRGDKRYFTPEFVDALCDAFARLYRVAKANSDTATTSLEPYTQLNNALSTKFDNKLSSDSIERSSNGSIHDPNIGNDLDTTVALPSSIASSARVVQHPYTAQAPSLPSLSLSPNARSKPQPIVVVGYDVRIGSAEIACALRQRLHESGLHVIDLGLITTPMMAFWAEQYDGHGIIVTASHSPKDILGVKWLYGHASPSDSDILALYHDLVQSPADPKPHPSPASRASARLLTLSSEAVATPYIDAIAQVFDEIARYRQLSSTDSAVMVTDPAPDTDASKLALNVVIDCMHGATSRIALPLFTRFCQRVIVINDTPNGHFPKGNPDPTERNRLAQLQQMVLAHEADIGLAFDGDGDRLMVIDDSGKLVLPDHLLYLLAQVALTERPAYWHHHSLTQQPFAQAPARQPLHEDTAAMRADDPLADDAADSAKVLFDVKCSHHLPMLLAALGTQPVISRTGSGFMRERLRSGEAGIIFAGELSGHFIFNDGYFTVYDDAMYASLRLLHWLATADEPVSIQSKITAQRNLADPLGAADNSHDCEHNCNCACDGGCHPSYNCNGGCGSDDDFNLSLGPTYELRTSTSGMRLSDLIRRLPPIVITSDHYLPIPSVPARTLVAPSDAPATDCSFISRLSSHCQHLQRQSAQTLSADQASSYPSANDDQQEALCTASCCLPNKTAAQARRLLPEGTQITCIDGIRLDFAYGFGVLRESNTSHSLTVRFAADTWDNLRRIQDHLVALCACIDTDVAMQIAAIYPE